MRTVLKVAILRMFFWSPKKSNSSFSIFYFEHSEDEITDVLDLPCRTRLDDEVCRGPGLPKVYWQRVH